MPKAMVRLSAGRVRMTLEEQALCFMAGANSIFAGDKLLTTPNPGAVQDKSMFQTLNLKPRKAYKNMENRCQFCRKNREKGLLNNVISCFKSENPCLKMTNLFTKAHASIRAFTVQHWVIAND